MSFLCRLIDVHFSTVAIAFGSRSLSYTCTQALFNVDPHLSLQSGLLLNKYTANSSQSDRWTEDTRSTQESPCSHNKHLRGEIYGRGKDLLEGSISRTQVCWVDYVLEKQPEDHLEPAGQAEVSPTAQGPGVSAGVMMSCISFLVRLSLRSLGLRGRFLYDR